MLLEVLFITVARCLKFTECALTQRKSDHEQLHQVSIPVVATTAVILLLIPII